MIERTPAMSALHVLVPARGFQAVFLAALMALFVTLAFSSFFNPSAEPPTGWRLDPQHGLVAELTSRGDDGFELEIFRLRDKQPWMARVTRIVVLRGGSTYRLTFEARADRARKMETRLRNGQAPWNGVGDPGEFTLAEVWKSFTLVVAAPHDLFDARIEMLLGQDMGRVEVRKVTLADE